MKISFYNCCRMIAKSPIVLFKRVAAFCNRKWRVIAHSDLKDNVSILCRRVSFAAQSIIAKLGIRQNARNQDGGCDNFFKAEIFTNYIQRLERTLEQLPSELNKSADPLHVRLRMLRSSFSSDNYKTEDQCRIWHKQILQDLRNLINDIGDEEGLVRNYLSELIYHRYFEIEMIDILGEHLKNRFSKFEELDSKQLYQYLKVHPSVGSNGNVLSLFDAHLFGNIPFKLPSITGNNGNPIRFVRMPSVTRDIKRDVSGAVQEVQVIEEFKLLMDSYKSKEMRHLYVNLMNRKQGNESLRSRVIEKMDGKSNIPLDVLTLDVESNFYRQKDTPDTLQFNQFRQDILENARSDWYHFPSRIKFDSLVFEKIVQEIHREYFESKNQLNRIERKNFIDLFNLKLIEYSLDILRPSSCNISCKHCIDRGPSQIIPFYLYMQKKGRTNFDNDLIKTLLFAPAFMVSNRLMQEDRFERVLSTIDVIRNNKAT